MCSFLRGGRSSVVRKSGERRSDGKTLEMCAFMRKVGAQPSFATMVRGL
jgi:hypothetical protein